LRKSKRDDVLAHRREQRSIAKLAAQAHSATALAVDRETDLPDSPAGRVLTQLFLLLTGYNNNNNNDNNGDDDEQRLLDFLVADFSPLLETDELIELSIANGVGIRLLQLLHNNVGEQLRSQLLLVIAALCGGSVEHVKQLANTGLIE
jgi:hypothetical protein